MPFDAFFLPVSPGRRFCLYHAPNPGGPCRGAVVYVHPFAEELNRSRRMAALQARAFAYAGYAVLQIDLHGCGDSSGDFAEATWDGWVSDVVAACDWLRARHDVPICLWGLRVGCLVAAEVARCETIDRLLLWQPTVSGAQFLTQFLRLRMASEMLSGEIKGVMAALRDDLANGRSVEILGYTISPALAQGLTASDLTLPERPVQVHWLEVGPGQTGGGSAVANQYVENWRRAGHRAQGLSIGGAAFWQVVEVDENPALMASSLSALEAMVTS